MGWVVGEQASVEVQKQKKRSSYLSGFSSLIVLKTAEINDMLYDPIRSETAKLEVGEITATGISLKSNSVGAVDSGNDTGTDTGALVSDCFSMVASEAKCVSYVPIRGEAGKLEGGTLVLRRVT